MPKYKYATLHANIIQLAKEHLTQSACVYIAGSAWVFLEKSPPAFIYTPHIDNPYVIEFNYVGIRPYHSNFDVQINAMSGEVSPFPQPEADLERFLTEGIVITYGLNDIIKEARQGSMPSIHALTNIFISYNEPLKPERNKTFNLETAETLYYFMTDTSHENQQLIQDICFRLTPEFHPVLNAAYTAALAIMQQANERLIQDLRERLFSFETQYRRLIHEHQHLHAQHETKSAQFTEFKNKSMSIQSELKQEINTLNQRLQSLKKNYSMQKKPIEFTPYSQSPPVIQGTHASEQDIIRKLTQENEKLTRKVQNLEIDKNTLSRKNIKMESDIKQIKKDYQDEKPVKKTKTPYIQKSNTPETENLSSHESNSSKTTSPVPVEVPSLTEPELDTKQPMHEPQMEQIDNNILEVIDPADIQLNHLITNKNLITEMINSPFKRSTFSLNSTQYQFYTAYRENDKKITENAERDFNSFHAKFISSPISSITIDKLQAVLETFRIRYAFMMRYKIWEPHFKTYFAYVTPKTKSQSVNTYESYIKKQAQNTLKNIFLSNAQRKNIMLVLNDHYKSCVTWSENSANPKIDAKHPLWEQLFPLIDSRFLDSVNKSKDKTETIKHGIAAAKDTLRSKDNIFVQLVKKDDEALKEIVDFIFICHSKMLSSEKDIALINMIKKQWESDMSSTNDTSPDPALIRRALGRYLLWIATATLSPSSFKPFDETYGKILQEKLDTFDNTSDMLLGIALPSTIKTIQAATHFSRNFLNACEVLSKINRNTEKDALLSCFMKPFDAKLDCLLASIEICIPINMRMNASFDFLTQMSCFLEAITRSNALSLMATAKANCVLLTRIIQACDGRLLEQMEIHLPGCRNIGSLHHILIEHKQLIQAMSHKNGTWTLTTDEIEFYGKWKGTIVAHNPTLVEILAAKCRYLSTIKIITGASAAVTTDDIKQLERCFEILDKTLNKAYSEPTQQPYCTLYGQDTITPPSTDLVPKPPEFK